SRSPGAAPGPRPATPAPCPRRRAAPRARSGRRSPDSPWAAAYGLGGPRNSLDTGQQAQLRRDADSVEQRSLAGPQPDQRGALDGDVDVRLRPVGLRPHLRDPRLVPDPRRRLDRLLGHLGPGRARLLDLRLRLGRLLLGLGLRLRMDGRGAGGLFRRGLVVRLDDAEGGYARRLQD